MTEEEIEEVRRVVREELEEELCKEGGIYDSTRTAALKTLIHLHFGQNAWGKLH